MAAPQLLEFLKNRFEPSTYMQSKRRSYSDFNAADRYAGGRLEYWQCALQMAEERPILGSGFHSFLYELPKYHSQQHSNYCHNQYLTVLAEGGVVWLSIFLMTIWKFLSMLYHGWRVHLKLKDTWGQIICGGAFLELVVLLWLAMSNDVLGPGPKNVIIWVLLAGGVRYGMLPPEEPEVEAQSAGQPTGP
jgi:hypothetical protein